ncbi:MAG: hypothetical protein HYZ28_24830 [Myxococcales bacterium]|nr:hypothetical protein [Myxococcales bacterium]
MRKAFDPAAALARSKQRLFLVAFLFAGALLGAYYLLRPGPAAEGERVEDRSTWQEEQQARRLARPALRPNGELFLIAEVERTRTREREFPLPPGEGRGRSSAPLYGQGPPAHAAGGGAEVISELGKCAEEGRASCLDSLARLDRIAAAATARRLQGREGLPPLLSELVSALSRFPAEGELGSHLSGLGLVDAKGLESAAGARQALLLAGKLAAVDPSCAALPCEHDRLLRVLLPLVGRELEAAEVEQLAHGGEAGARAGHDYLLRVYFRGERHSTAALNFGRWYDLDSSVGLLNAVLEAAGSEFRYVVLATDRPVAIVAAGPRVALERAHEEGLLLVGEASYAMNLAKWR